MANKKDRAAEEEQDLVPREINGEARMWSKSLGGPVTEVKHVEDEEGEGEDKLKPSKDPEGIELHPRLDWPSTIPAPPTTEEARSDSELSQTGPTPEPALSETAVATP
ncbi:hypothetical protein IAD21_00890 [Abditibacteriota bacterium]|nr:hypothetical protein IAD21_00890 [Abditibacteriota bacterium]